MELPLLWILSSDPDVSWEFGELLLKDESLGMPNHHEVAVAEDQLRDATNSLVPSDVPLPQGFPAPRLVLPEHGFAPDFFIFDGRRFCSRQLRDALAQPPHVVQYTPVEILAGGEQVRAQDYRVLRVLARQPAMDLERSECDLEDWVNRITGVPQKVPLFIDRFVLLAGLHPKTDIFRMDESPSYVLVTDALAMRVLRAGCTGLEFVDPACPRRGPRVVRYRTADAVGEKRVHMLD